MCVARFAAHLIIFLLAVQSFGQQGPLTLTQRAGLASPILLHAESAVEAAAPAPRAFLLYRAAGAWLDLDPARAINLDRRAFDAAQLIDYLPLRKMAEHDILSDLLPLSPSALLEIIPQAEPETQGQLYRAAINFSLTQADLPGAQKAFDQASSAGIFSEIVAANVLNASSQSRVADRVRIFNSALAAYKAQTSKDSRFWTASGLIAQFWQNLPQEAVVSGIDIVLDRAGEKDKGLSGGSGNISRGRNTLTYKSYTDLELFAVAPALKKCAPDRAATLIAAHPAVQEYLLRFPDGLASFGNSLPRSALSQNPAIFVPHGLTSYATGKGAHSMGLSPLDMGLEFTIPLYLPEGLGVTGSTVYFARPGSPEASFLGTGNACPPDVAQILASIDTVPFSRREPTFCSVGCSYQDTYPRAEVLNKIAERCTYYPGKPEAFATLKTELQLIDQLPPDQRVPLLANAADLYLRLGDKEAATAVVQKGFEVAALLFAQDSQSKELQGLPKAVWPSAEAYRWMISLGTNADLEKTRAVIESIPDPELRELEQVMMARSLLGIPVRRNIISYRNGLMVTIESEPGYGNL